MSRNQLKLALFLWSLAGFAYVCVYCYVFVWLISCALVFQWNNLQHWVAILLTTSALAAVWFLTRKIHNILVLLAQKDKSCYTVYMIDEHNDDSKKETTGGELFVQAIGCTAFIILGFWGAVHVLLSLMDAI